MIRALIGLFLWVGLTHAGTSMELLVRMKPIHPDFPRVLSEIQFQKIKEKKWQNVMAIGYVYRKNILENSDYFYAGPLLMEAYALVQFCRYEDAKNVLNLGEYYATKFNQIDDLAKVKKAQELKELSALFNNQNQYAEVSSDFKENQIKWTIDNENKEIYPLLDQLIIETRSLCDT